MLEAVIFDFDGTLFDSMYVWETVGDEYLRSQGVQAVKGLWQKNAAMSLEQAACFLQRDYGLDRSIDEIMRGINSIVEHAYYHDILPKPGVEAFLEQLRGEDVRMCIATMTDRYLIEAALGRFGLQGYFEDILTCGDLGCAKSDPTIYDEACARMGVQRDRAVVFEDSPFATRAAKSGGYTVVAVRDRREERFRAACEHADFALDDYREPEGFRRFAAERWA